MGDSKGTGTSRSEEKSKKRPARSTKNTLLYIGSVVILVLVVVTFVGVPAAGGFSQPAGSIVFGRYDGEEIAYRPGNFFARQYEIVAQSLRDSSGDLDLELQLRIAWRQAFNRAVLRTAILRQAERSNMRVSEARVDELIAQDPRFQQNGRFDASAYRNISNQEQFSLRNFHRESAIFNRFVQDTLNGSVSGEAEKRFVAAMAGPERSFEVVRFPFDDFPEQQVREYAQENATLFTELNLSVITLASQEEAGRVRAQAHEPGNPFGELARTYSRDLYADQSGEIGSVWGYEIQQELLNPEDLEQLIALENGTMSEPIETTSGWSFYRAESDPVAFDPEDQAAVAEALSYMQMFEQGRIQDFARNEAQRFVQAASGTPLEILATEWNRSVHETPFFPINYGNSQLFNQLNVPAVPDLQDAANREGFFVTAFSLGEEELSDPIMLRRSTVVLRLREERPVDETTMGFIVDYYDSIRGQFQSDEIENAYLDEDRLEDNFVPAFNRYVLGNR